MHLLAEAFKPSHSQALISIPKQDIFSMVGCAMVTSKQFTVQFPKANSHCMPLIQSSFAPPRKSKKEAPLSRAQGRTAAVQAVAAAKRQPLDHVVRVRLHIVSSLQSNHTVITLCFTLWYRLKLNLLVYGKLLRGRFHRTIDLPVGRQYMQGKTSCRPLLMLHRW